MIIYGDCLDEMKKMEENSIDFICTDPPYGLHFMGKDWDGRIPAIEVWAEALRICKPGAMLASFGGSRTHHHLMCAIEGAGWEIRDVIMWLFGSGFPKSLDISKAIDKSGGSPCAFHAFADEYNNAIKNSRYNHSEIDDILGIKSSSSYWARKDHRGGMPPRHHWEKLKELLSLPDELLKLYDQCEREIIGKGKSGKTAIWQENGMGDFNITCASSSLAKTFSGYGTALKPAYEPIILAMKPLDGTFAQNAEKWGVAGINIDESRIGTELVEKGHFKRNNISGLGGGYLKGIKPTENKQFSQGRWPANVILDEEAAEQLDEMTGNNVSRFFFCAKASSGERNNGLEGMELKETDLKSFGTSRLNDLRMKNEQKRNPKQNTHPTVKPIALMKYLIKLLAPPGNPILLDPFCGSGSTLVAAKELGVRAVGIEKQKDYCEIAEKRIDSVELNMFNYQNYGALNG
ncbi:MAG TPA: DNA methyltransferase [Nitrososphaeraceae archaeon]